MGSFGRVFKNLVAMAFATVAGSLFAAEPQWFASNYLSNAPVCEVICTDRSLGAELVVLSPRFGSLRMGAVCEVVRDGKNIGSIVVIDSSENRNVAISIGKVSVQSGDAVYPQITR